ncbi:MAG: pilus assembly protein PilM [Phycisphaerae bacterium]|nr:pilus assembly protein PilM [Phycisphaerae bacterium]
MTWPAILGTRSAVIGLDIGTRSIKAAQISGGELTAAISMPRPDAAASLPAEAEFRQIAAVLRSRPFRGRSVVVAVPATQLMTSILELPPRSSGAPIEQLAAMELGRRYDVEPAAFEADSWDLPSPVRAASRTCVMAVGCKKQDASRLLDELEPHGLSVTAVDIHALAIARACRPVLAAADDTGAILDIGWSSSRLVLVYHGTVVYERNLARHGASAMVSLLAADAEVDAATAENLLTRDGLNAPPAPARTDDDVSLRADGLLSQLDTMAGEIRTPLSYLASQYSDATVKRLVLVGGGAHIPGLAERLSERLGIETLRPSLDDLCPCDAELSALGPSMAAAVGLAQYAEGDQ